MDKIDVIQKIKREKIISVIRSENQEEIEKIIDSIVAGGVHLIEITMTVPNAVGIIEGLVKKYKNTDVTIGAGTVLDAETAKLVINAGAEFVVSPIFDKDLMKMFHPDNVTGDHEMVQIITREYEELKRAYEMGSQAR